MAVGEISAALANSMDISRSPHLVKRSDTKDPYGSTVASAFTVQKKHPQPQQRMFTYKTGNIETTLIKLVRLLN